MAANLRDLEGLSPAQRQLQLVIFVEMLLFVSYSGTTKPVGPAILGNYAINACYRGAVTFSLL